MNSLRKMDVFFRNHPLTRDARHRAWFRFLLWQIRSRLQSEVVFNWVEGQKLVVQKGMTGATGNIYAGLHEFSDMALLIHFLRPGDLFVDIGANIGSFTVLASGVCGARTFSFEPDPNTVKSLKKNIEINNLENLVAVFEMALGDSNSLVNFSVGMDTVNRVVRGDDNLFSRQVIQSRLDDVLADSDPSMIKIDVEGYEEKVLSGGVETFKRESLKLIELETSSPAIERCLGRLGFSRGFYDPALRVFNSNEGELKSSNATFVRDESFVNERLVGARQVRVLEGYI